MAFYLVVLRDSGIYSTTPESGGQHTYTAPVPMSCVANSGFAFYRWKIEDDDTGTVTYVSQQSFTFSGTDGHGYISTATSVPYVPPVVTPTLTATASGNAIRFSISGASATYKYFRLFYRKSSESIATRIPAEGASPGYLVHTSDFDYDVTGMEYNTAYVVNAAYSATGAETAGDWAYCGAITITTGVEPSGSARIYTSASWKTAVPYIYTSAGWKPATAYIYTANGWKEGL